MKMCDRIPDALALDLGNQMYVINADTEEERDAFIRMSRPLPDAGPRGFFAAAGEKFLFPLFTAAREKVYNTKY